MTATISFIVSNGALPKYLASRHVTQPLLLLRARQNQTGIETTAVTSNWIPKPLIWD